MKRIFVIFGIYLFAILWSLVFIIPVIASDISNADFYGIVQTTNNSTASNSVITTITNLNAANFISAGFLNATANNCAIQNSTGVDVPFMPGYATNPTVMFNGSVGASTITNSPFYSKNVTGGKIVYIPGSTGLGVSDHATLEFGNNFNIKLYNILTDTANGTSKYDFYKPGAFWIRNSPTVSGTKEASILTQNVTIDSTTGGTGLTAASFSATYGAGYVAGDLLMIIYSTHNIAGANNVGAPAGFTNNFWQLNDGIHYFTLGVAWKVADGAEGASGTFTNSVNSEWSYVSYRIDKDSYQGNPAIYPNLVFGTASNPDPHSLTSGFGAVSTNYFAACLSSTAQAAAPAGYSGFVGYGLDNYRTYSSYKNVAAATEDPGTFPNSVADWLTTTIAIQGKEHAILTVTAPGVTAVEHSLFNIYADTTNLSFAIDGTVFGSVALAGATVIDNSNNIMICSSNATTYVGSMEIDVGGIQRGLWSWQYAATFTDASGNGNTGTPSFPTTGNNANVSSILILFAPITEPTAPAFVIGEGPDFMDTSNVTTGIFTTGGNTTVHKYPFEDLIESVATAGGVPYQIPSTFIASFCLITLSMLTSFFLKRYSAQSIFIKSVVNTVGYGVLVALGIYDWWMIIMFFIFEQSIWFGAQHRRE